MAKNKRNAGQAWIPVLLLVIAVLGGCMYRGSGEEDGRSTVLEYLAEVQAAVDLYHRETGTLPIRTGDPDAPVYEKYAIDFERLIRSPFLAEIPPNAFEKGGSSQYVLVNAERDPTVKLLDLPVAQKVNEVQRKVREFAGERQGALPFGEPLQNGWHFIDFSKLGIGEVQVRSVYSHQYLPLILNENGRVAIHYGPDLMQFVLRRGLAPDPGLDLRTLLVDHFPHVPAKSAAYHWLQGEPIISEN